MRDFTLTEDDLIRQIYPEQGVGGCLKVLVGRSRSAVIWRAEKLGVRGRANELVWSPDPLNVTADAWRGPVDKGVMRWAA